MMLACEGLAVLCPPQPPLDRRGDLLPQDVELAIDFLDTPPRAGALRPVSLRDRLANRTAIDRRAAPKCPCIDTGG